MYKINWEFEKFKWENFENIFGDRFKDFISWEEYKNKIKEYYKIMHHNKECMCLECIKNHIITGCNYGQSNGPDDVTKECDCQEGE